MRPCHVALVTFAFVLVAHGETINPAEYANAVQIRFDGYAETTPLTNFPALVTFSDGDKGFRYSAMESDDYSDLRFAQSDGTSSIPFEVEVWNSTTPTATGPTNITGCVLWFKADAGVSTNAVGGVTEWLDQSGNGNDAILANGNPILATTVVNGLPVVRFDGMDDRLTFPEVADIRTVFWVLREDADATADMFRPLLSHSDNPPHWHRGQNKAIWAGPAAGGWASPEVHQGETRVNGAIVDSDVAVVPTSHAVVSVVTMGPVRANQLGRDRTAWPTRVWKGDFAEVIVYNRALTPLEVANVHLYLAAKYAIDVAADAAATRSYVWVQVPVLTNNASIYAYWGNPSATVIPAYATNGTTWNSGFEAVYHLAETTGNALDSTANNLDATVLNGTVQNHPSQVGPAYFFDGANDYLSCDARIFQTVPSRFSVEWWVYPKNYVNWNQVLQAETGSWNYWMFHTDANGRACVGTRNNAASRINVDGGMTDVYTWRHFAYTYDNGLARFYKNGDLVGELPNSNPSVGGWNGFRIGVGGGSTINGIADEVRLSNVGWSPDWITACYANQANPGTFSTVELAYYWDTSTTAGLQAGDGVWSATNAKWSSSEFGSNPLKTWDNGATATFAAGGTSVVSLANISAHAVIVDGDGYSFTNGTLTLDRGGLAANESLSLASAVTLADAQEWNVASGKTLTVSGTIDNGGNLLTVMGEGDVALAGVISGTGGLIMDSTGTGVIDAYDTYTGGTLVNRGTLQLNRGGNSGALSGELTIERNGRVDLTIDNALGWGANRITTLNINGGLLNNVAGGDNGWGITINLDGGELRSNGGVSDGGTPQLFSLGGGSTIRTLGGSNTALVSGRVNLREGNPDNSLIFDVGDSGTSSGLVVTAAITEQGGARAVTKRGGGVMVVTANNPYTGGTTVENGTLLVNNTAGSGVGSGAVTLNGGTLGGTGTIGATVTVGTSGFVAPGAGVGTLRIEGDLDLTSAGLSGLYVEIDASNAYDRLMVTGQVTLGGATLAGELGFTPGSNDTFFVLVNEGPSPINGTFNGIAQGGAVEIGGTTFRVSYTGDSASKATTGGNDVVLYGAQGTGGPVGHVGGPYWQQLSFPGYTLDSALTNFPALVVLGDAMDKFSYATVLSPTGDDLRFFTETNDATRTELHYEVENWYTNGLSHVWVQIPVLTNGTSIWAYWGDTNLTTQPAYTTNGATWSQDYVGVYHLSEKGSTLNYADSSPEANDLISSASPEEAEGKVARCRSFTINDTGQPPRISSPSGGLTLDEVSVMVWVNLSNGGTWRNWWGIEAGAGNHLRMELDSEAPGKCNIYANGITGAEMISNPNDPVEDGKWHLLAFTASAGADHQAKVYVDGVQDGSTVTWSATAAATGLKVGASWVGGYAGAIGGRIDEARFAKSARSDDWVWACYQNQVDAKTFMGIPSVASYWDTSSAFGLQAGSGTWDNDVTPAWSDNELLGSGPIMTWNPAWRDAYFTANGASDVTVDNATANRIVIEGTGYTLSGGTLALSAGVEANESASINSTVDLYSDQVWAVVGGKTLTSTGVLSGPYRITKTGDGTLILNAHNDFTGGVTVDAGTLLVNIGNWYENPGQGNGKLIVNEGGLADFRGAHAFGSGADGRDAHINGGRLYFQNENYVRAIEMTAGLIYGAGENRAAGGAFAIYAADRPSIVSNRMNMVNAKTFNVADGAAADDLIMAGPIVGGGALTKTGLGVMSTWGANTYTGVTTIDAGTLRVNGSHSATNAYTIDGGTLGGTGTVAAAVSFGANGGSIAPGSVTGTLTVDNDVTFTSAGVTRLDARVENQANYSGLAVNGAVTLDNAVLSLSVGDGVAGGEKLFLIVNDGTDPIDGTFNGLAEGQSFSVPADSGSEIPFTIYYGGDSATGSPTGGNDVVLMVGSPGMLLLVR